MTTPTPIKSAALSVREQAEQEVASERRTDALAAMKGVLRKLDAAKAIVANLEREVQDLELSIADGSFVKGGSR